MITQAEYLAMQARLRIHEKVAELADADACDREAELHRQILDECRRREWLVIHSRMDRAATVALGTPDMAIFRHGGKCLFVECKRASAKLTIEQQAFRAWAEKLHHQYFLVRSFERFLEIVRGLQ